MESANSMISKPILGYVSLHYLSYLLIGTNCNEWMKENNEKSEMENDNLTEIQPNPLTILEVSWDRDIREDRGVHKI